MFEIGTKIATFSFVSCQYVLLRFIVNVVAFDVDLTILLVVMIRCRAENKYE